MTRVRTTIGFSGGHAVVLGASVAGLAAARVLAPHFDRVTLVERDSLPDALDVRKSVQQARHVHVLLGAGLTIIAELFPGLVEGMVEDGARLGDVGKDMAWYHYGVWKARFTSGMPFLYCSRQLLEHHLRRHVGAIPNVELLDQTTATGLLVSADRTRIAGVRVERAGLRPTERSADLVADATGRGSQSPRWLEAAGYRRPPETRVGIDIAYVSRIYRCPERLRDRPQFLVIYPKPPEEKRSGILYSIEGDRWLVSLNGYFGEHPPLDGAGFVEFARTLPRPEIHELIKGATPLSAPVMYRFPSNVRRHYESMRRRPEGLLVLGDAACTFNPIFGQGMSVACLGAMALAQCLREQPPGDGAGLATRLQRALAAATDLPWGLATAEDLRYPQAIGKRPFWLGALSWYKTKLLEMCSFDTGIYGRYLLVLHLMRRSPTLFTPSMLLSVLRYAIRGRLARLPLEERPDSQPIYKEDPATRALVSARFPQFDSVRAR